MPSWLNQLWHSEEVVRPVRVDHPSGDVWVLYDDNLYRRTAVEKRPLSKGALYDDMDRWETRSHGDFGGKSRSIGNKSW